MSSLGDNVFILHTTCEQKDDKVILYIDNYIIDNYIIKYT